MAGVCKMLKTVVAYTVNVYPGTETVSNSNISQMVILRTPQQPNSLNILVLLKVIFRVREIPAAEALYVVVVCPLQCRASLSI